MRIGFTLLETLISLAVLSLALVLFGGIVQHYVTLSHASFQRGEMGSHSQTIQVMRNEILGCTEILEPTDGRPKERLRFRKIDSALPRFPRTTPSMWKPIVPEKTVEVTYFQAKGQLMRTIHEQTEEWMNGVEGFSVARLAPNDLECSFTIERVGTVRSHVYLWSQEKQ